MLSGSSRLASCLRDAGPTRTTRMTMRSKTPPVRSASRSILRPARDQHVHIARGAAVQRLERHPLSHAITGQPIEEILRGLDSSTTKLEQDVADDNACCLGWTSGCDTDDEQCASVI